MTIWKTGAAAGALLVAAGAGAALMPAVHGQSADREPLVRALEMVGRDAQIGVTVRDVEPADKTNGVVVEDVRTGSAAEKAGMKRGDVVVEFDGERVRSVGQFSRLVRETPENRAVQAVLMRDGQRVTVSVTPDRNRSFYYGDDFARIAPVAPAVPSTPRPPRTLIAPAMPRDFETFTLHSGGGRLGISTENLTDQLREYFGVKTGGVLVRSVTDNSVAAQAGLKAGDVVVAVNGHAVERPTDITTELRGDSTDFTLDVVRDRKTMTLKGKLEARDTRARRRTIV